MADLDIDPSTKLFRRMLRLPLFYALQPLHDCSINDENFDLAVQAYSSSLEAIGISCLLIVGWLIKFFHESSSI